MKAFIATAQVKKKNNMNVSEVPLCGTSVLPTTSVLSPYQGVTHIYCITITLNLFFKNYYLGNSYMHLVHFCHPHSPLPSLTLRLLFLIPFFHTHVCLLVL